MHRHVRPVALGCRHEGGDRRVPESAGAALTVPWRGDLSLYAYIERMIVKTDIVKLTFLPPL